MLTSRGGRAASGMALALGMLLGGSGCRTHYGLQSVAPPHALQWPFAFHPDHLLGKSS